MAKNNGSKKPFYMRWWFIVLMVLLAIGFIGNLGDKGDDNKDMPSETTTKATTTVAPTATTTTAEPTMSPDAIYTAAAETVQAEIATKAALNPTATTAAPTTADTAAMDEAILVILQDNFGKENVTFDKELMTFSIVPADEGFLTELAAALEGDADAIESWNTMVENFVSLSNSINDLGSGYILSITNPTNPDNTLLMVMDGIVFYDVVSAGS